MNVAILSLTLATILAPEAAFAQKIHQRSRFDEAAASSSAFNPREAALLLEPGDGGIKGRLELTYKSGLLSKKQKIWADKEMVYLFPMTSYMQAWASKYGNQSGIGMAMMAPEAGDYTARTMTDSEGNFELRGLKAGKYLFYASIPYAVEGVRREATDQRTYTIDYLQGTATSSPVYKETKTTFEQEHRILAIVEVKPHQITDVTAGK